MSDVMSKTREERERDALKAQLAELDQMRCSQIQILTLVLAEAVGLLRNTVKTLDCNATRHWGIATLMDNAQLFLARPEIAALSGTI